MVDNQTAIVRTWVLGRFVGPLKKCRDVLFEFHLKFWNITSIGIPVRSYYKVDRLLTGLTAQQKGKIAQWYSNKTSLSSKKVLVRSNKLGSRIFQNNASWIGEFKL